MGRIQYTEEQLLALKDSPLIRRPDDLPRIEQWIEYIRTSRPVVAPPEGLADRVRQTQDKNQTRPRTQNGRTEENENPLKRERPSLESRKSTQPGQSYPSNTSLRNLLTCGVEGDIFLGPRMSFASASAARQTSKLANGEERPFSQDRPERFSGKDRYGKDGDQRERDFDRLRPKFGPRSGATEEEGMNDRYQRRHQDHNERNKDTKDGGVALDGINGRRNGPLRTGKLDQPWFRDSTKAEVREGDSPSMGDNARKDSHRSQDSWHRDQQAEREPQWMQEPASDGMDHTADEFAKWKASMKASKGDSDEPATAGFFETTETGQPDNCVEAKPKVPEGGIFGFGGAKLDEEAAMTKGPSKPKTSRFAAFFAPKEPEPPVEPSPPAEKIETPPQKSNDDQAGFQRMMQMLRMGGTSSQGPEPTNMGRAPPPHASQERSAPQPELFGQSRQSIDTDVQTRQTPASPITQQPPQRLPSGPPPNIHHPRPEPARKDSDFLLKLMQQPRGSPAFNEGQIYGQNYHSKNSSSEINSLLNSFSSRPEPKVRGPPPGFPPSVNEQAFRANQNLPPSPPQQFRGLPQYQPRPAPAEDRYPPMTSPYEQQSSFFGRQAEQAPKPQDIRPPPGFGAGPSGGGLRGAPPGFPQMQHQQPSQSMYPQYQQQSNHHQQPPQPSQQPRPSMPPPGFYQGPPPGFPQQQHQQPQHHQPQPQRRQQGPGMNVPPGYEGYGDMARRPQMGYPQYLDQRGGGY